MKASDLEWIVNASYSDLLRRWRYAPVGDIMFSDPELFERYTEKMRRMEAADPGLRVRTSKTYASILHLTRS